MGRSTPNSSFSDRVLAWFDHSGRKDLPWQHNINPYRVWLSEIMLQQTQVRTVIPYFQRFTETYSNVSELAQASDDEVLHLWTGLGYYSRARNLLKAAKQVCREFNGEFPDNVEQLCTLPGIGLSTAGAIVSIAFSRRAAILDGNVKRVLARHGAISGWPGKSTVLKTLWESAQTYTPTSRPGNYSQAMMDLGATVCTRSQPSCQQCPLNSDCLALQRDEISHYPGKKPKKVMPVKTTQMLIILNPAGEVLLEKRPNSGIWGGLWIFPQIDIDDDPQQYCEDKLQQRPQSIKQWQMIRHTFSHYHLDISPVIVALTIEPSRVMEDGRQLWYNSKNPPTIGLAAPIEKLIKQLE